MLLQNIPLKKYSKYKIGGPASYFFEFKSKEELISAVKEFRETEESGKILVIGSATNILFSDSGFSGLVLKNDISFIKREGEMVEVGAGTLVADLVSFCAQNSLSGMEWAGGLPGTVGGAIRGNAGAFLGETKDSVLEVESLNIDSLQVNLKSKKDCGFDYRQSVFKNGEGEQEIIISAKFKFEKGDRELIKKTTQEKIDYRIERHPLDLPNIGSTFKNVPADSVSEEVRKEFEKNIKPDPFPVIPAAKLIIGAGMIGGKVGGAQVSTKHPNFIVNLGSAKASDVLALIEKVKEKVREKYDIILEPEVMFV